MSETNETPVNRAGETALKVLGQQLLREHGGLTLSRHTRQELAEKAERIGISREEAEELIMALLPKLIGNALGFGSVSINAGDPIPFDTAAGNCSRCHGHDHDHGDGFFHNHHGGH